MPQPQGTPLASIPAIVGELRRQWPLWRRLSAAERAARILPLAALFEQQSDELARLITNDMGKPIRQSRNEVKRCVEGVRYLCEACPDWIKPEAAPGGIVYFDPIGVVAVIAPWNYPYALPLLVALPALIAGNMVVLKPSEYSLESGAALWRLFEQTIPGCVSIVLGGREHGEALVRQPDVAMVALTGSSRAGKEVMRVAAERLCRVSLELGGIDAAIVLDDMEPEVAAAALIAKNCSNAGQICCAAKWAYVPRGKFEAFVTAYKRLASEIKMGDPLDPTTELGPLVNMVQLRSVAALVDNACAQGATAECGGRAAGSFYPPTLLTGITDEMRIVREECFGPVLPLMPYDSIEQVIERINCHAYGLTASVWTNDKDSAEKIALQLDVGVVNVNTHGIPPLGAPWGGARESGIGRTRSREGMHEFCNIKYVGVREPPQGRECKL